MPYVGNETGLLNLYHLDGNGNDSATGVLNYTLTTPTLPSGSKAVVMRPTASRAVRRRDVLAAVAGIVPNLNERTAVIRLKMASQDRQDVFIKPDAVVAIEGHVSVRKDVPVSRVYLVGNHWIDVEADPSWLQVKLKESGL